MGGKPKSKLDKSKSSKSKGKDKDKKGKKSSKDVSKKGNKSKDKSSSKEKKEELEKNAEDKEIETPINNMDNKNLEKENLIQNLSKNPNFNENYKNPNIKPPNQLYGEKCEGCFQGDGIIFCSDCGKIYCKTCDDQLHVIPSFRTHERTPLSVFTEFEKNCYYHNQPLRLFCESCHEPICKYCQKEGPHNTPLHIIGSLFSIYKKFLDIGKNYLNGPIKEKSYKIEELMIQIDELLKENKSKAREMLHGISLEYESIIENITKIDGNKKAELSYNASEIQKDIISIQKILDYLGQKNIKYFNQENGGQKNPFEEDENDKMINFVLQSKSLMNEIDKIISKPTNKILTKEDEKQILEWPKELNDSKEKLANYRKYKAILKVKDDIIWKLLTTPYEEHNPEFFEIEKKANEEIQHWNELIEKTKSEIEKYNLVCHFCGCSLENGKNSPCEVNTEVYPYENKNLTDEVPNQEFIGNNRHYFAEPTEDYQVKINTGQYFDANEYMKSKNLSKYNQNLMRSMEKSENLRKKPMDIFDLMKPSMTTDWVNKSARTIENEKINLFQVLSHYDNRNSGFITIRELMTAFQKIQIVLNDEDKDSLKKYLKMSGYDENKINIEQFAKNFGKIYSGEDDKNDTYPQNHSNGFRYINNAPPNQSYPNFNQMNSNEPGYTY